MDCRAFLDTIVNQMFAIRMGQYYPKAAVLSEDRIVQSLESMCDLNCPDKTGNTLLVYAATYNLHNVMDYLLQHGANVDYHGYQGTTALHAAMTNSNWSAV